MRETLNLSLCADSITNNIKRTNVQKKCHMPHFTCHMSHVTGHLSADHHSMQLQLLSNVVNLPPAFCFIKCTWAGPPTALKVAAWQKKTLVKNLRQWHGETETTMGIATYRLNWPRCRCSEKYMMLKI